METKYDITGMSCAACSARVEKAVSSLDGVEKCSVNLLTNSMSVSGNVKSETIISAVEKAGYGASECGSDKKKISDEKPENPIKPLKNRLIYSLIFLVILMYISMGHIMWGLPVPEVFANDPVSLTIAQLILSAIILVINQKFFVSGFKAAIRRSPNMDTLVALGSGAAFVYSTYVLFAMSMAQSIGDTASVHKYMHDLYFESAAMILTLITVGKMLEAFSKGKTTNALNALMKLTPKKATVIKDGVETEINASELLKDDIFVVKPGESIPADGVVIEGTSSVDESALTGESVPVDKEAGSRVSAATINKYGYMQCRATNVGEDTSLAKIIKMVSDAASGKAPIAKIADKVSGVFVPTVIIIALVTIIVWLMLGKSAGFALARGISVLVIICPCALGLATPVAIMVGNGVGAKNGILFKTAESLEQTGKIKVCIFDKTGTVTKGKPSVTDVKAFDGCSEETLLTLAYSLEKMSEHPLSYAIVEHCSQSFEAKKAENFLIHPGNGLSATIDGSVI